MIVLTTNHKVNDVVYVVADCVRRGVVKQVDFSQTSSTTTPFTLAYEILYDGFSINTTIASVINPVGSPLVAGSPTGIGAGSPNTQVITLGEDANAGGIFTDKDAALTAFGVTLA